MAKAKENAPSNLTAKRPRPAATPEARENQLIALAVDRVEQRLLDGSATSQEIIHFLKLGSIKEQLEMEKLRKENELLKAKTEAIQSGQRMEELYDKAIAAMKSYGVHDGGEEEYAE